MDRVLFLDLNNFAWLANIVFKPKPKPIVLEWGDKEQPYPGVGLEPPASTEEKPVPPENILVFNFFRNLRALVEPFAPHKIVAVREGHPAFRYELYADYKANRIIKTASRVEAKERFDKAFPEIIRLLKLMPITVMRHPHYEADDTIATLVDDSQREGNLLDVIVVSNDSDYIQLLQKGYKHFRLYSPSKKIMIADPGYHYLTWKCLCGDKSDNIAGMTGPKTAEKLAKDPELLKKWLEKEENRANFNINKQLIEFATVPLDELEVEECSRNWEQLKIEFEQFDFKSLITDAYWKKFVMTFRPCRY